MDDKMLSLFHQIFVEKLICSAVVTILMASSELQNMLVRTLKKEGKKKKNTKEKCPEWGRMNYNDIPSGIAQLGEFNQAPDCIPWVLLWNPRTHKQFPVLFDHRILAPTTPNVSFHILEMQFEKCLVIW